jgi:hypothetical protein
VSEEVIRFYQRLYIFESRLLDADAFAFFLLEGLYDVLISSNKTKFDVLASPGFSGIPLLRYGVFRVRHVTISVILTPSKQIFGALLGCSGR